MKSKMASTFSFQMIKQLILIPFPVLLYIKVKWGSDIFQVIFHIRRIQNNPLSDSQLDVLHLFPSQFHISDDSLLYRIGNNCLKYNFQRFNYKDMKYAFRDNI